MSERNTSAPVRELRKFVAPEFVYGSGACRLAGQYALKLGARRLLLVTDAGVRAAGWPDVVGVSLRDAGLAWHLFDGVTPNPRISEVMAGARAFLEYRCDGLLAVGGGSPIDCAKGIGVVVANGGEILDYEGVDRVQLPMPPVLCVSTSAGTGADVSQFAILLDEASRRKVALISKALVPDLALVDPDTAATLSPFLRACTSLDALVHAIEAYTSTGHSPVTDLHALEAIRLQGTCLAPFVAGESDQARDSAMLASLQAGLAFSNASLGLVHAMSHSLGGMLDLPHGECNALLLEHVIAFNFPCAAERYAVVARALGVDTKGLSDPEIRQALTGYIRALRTSVGVSHTLSKTGVNTRDLGQLARNAFRDACIVTNARTPTLAEIEQVYEHAL